MAFDAGMLSCMTHEILSLSRGARVEKVYQPDRDEIHIQIRSLQGGKRLLINAGSNNPRIGFTEIAKENPQNPPMFCVLLRKHLQGAKLSNIEQLGFERAVRLGFECRDELGFECKKYLVAEVMGKYSNLIFLDENMKVIAAHRPVDFTTSSRRQVLAGMKYELPPAQDKADPTAETEVGFCEKYAAASPEQRADKYITNTYMGISAAVAREMVYRATRHTDTPIKYCDSDRLWKQFRVVFDAIETGNYHPTLAVVEGRPTEYAFVELTQYTGAELRNFDSAGALLDAFYGERDRAQKVKQRASDILRLISNAQSRIVRKLENQRGELAECEKGEEFKRRGDLITANMYAIEKGSSEVLLTDYCAQREDGRYRHNRR